MSLRIFMAGDVMTGRGIDQILPHPGDPRLYESYMRDARDYVTLAERRNGPVPRGVPYGYIWGDLLADLDARACDLRLVNLETAITHADQPAPKGINYRMAPDNAPALTAAAIDGCALANNHVLDWGAAGLTETLDTLDRLGIDHAGAGRNAAEAARPLIRVVPGKGRLLMLAFGAPSSGIPEDWRAGPDHPGLSLLSGKPEDTLTAVRAQVDPLRRPGDLLAVSLHWGGNWGYEIPPDHRSLAQALIDQAGVDLVFGHSSHHPLGIEIHQGRPIVYGAGDLINDYEGIGGKERYKPDLGLGYVFDFDAATGRLKGLEMLPYRRVQLTLRHAEAEETAWLADMLARESALDGGHIEITESRTLRLRPAAC